MNIPLVLTQAPSSSPMTYGAIKMVICRLGRKALGERVTPHMLRHSSGTYYANLLKSPYKLCYRYGWTMSSKMVDRYLDRKGILEEETATVVRAEGTYPVHKGRDSLREEFTQLQEANRELVERFRRLQKSLDERGESNSWSK